MIIHLFRKKQQPVLIQAASEAEALSELAQYGVEVASLKAFSQLAHEEFLFPSGVYSCELDASEAIKALAGEQHAKLISTFLNETGWSQKQLSNAIGFTDSRNDGNNIRKILACKSRLAGPSLRQVAQLIAGRVLKTKAEEEQVLQSYNSAAWKEVKWCQVRAKAWKL